jgi:hypothetical protein
MNSYFDYNTREVRLEIDKVENDADPNAYNFGMKINNLNEGAQTFFNLEFTEFIYRPPTAQAPGTMFVIVENVWNREFLFVHASFVNGTSFNYLGRSGEFYPKPSKMYRFGGSSQQFYFELSLDGRPPVNHVLGNFCIDLAFIYHDKDYQAE